MEIEQIKNKILNEIITNFVTDIPKTKEINEIIDQSKTMIHKIFSLILPDHTIEYKANLDP